METNTLIFNDRLFHQYPAIADQLYLDARNNGSRVQLIDKSQTRNIWTRDHAPQQVNQHFVKFKYFGKEVTKVSYSFLEDVRYSPIMLDGGNVQRNGDVAIVTDIIFKHNPGLKLGVLEKILEAKVVVIPAEPGDKLGHADGVCAWLPGTQKLLVNDYFEVPEFTEYELKLLSTLDEHGIEWERFPFAAHKKPEEDDNPLSAFGYYINFLCVNKTVWVPQFGVEEDAEAVKFMTKALPGYTIRPIDCRKVSAEGGTVHCLCMDYKM